MMEEKQNLVNDEAVKTENVEKPKRAGAAVFTWPHADGTARTITLNKGLVISCCCLVALCMGAVVASGIYWVRSSQERLELANYRAQYAVYTERLQKLVEDNEKMQKELAQVVALEAAVRKKLAKEGDGIPKGEIDKESQNLDNAGKGGNNEVDKLSLLEVQNEINYKRLAYKKENLYNMLNELSNVGDGTYGWPLDGGEISSFYGYRVDPFGSGGGDFHPGIDIAANYGEPIKASCAGTVEMADWNGGYGRYVRINHNNGYETAYGHMSAITVQPGQKVTKGQVIGYVGSSGASTGPHVHFEIIKNGDTDNPLAYVAPGKHR